MRAEQMVSNYWEIAALYPTSDKITVTGKLQSQKLDRGKTRGKVMMITLTKVKSYNSYIIQSTWNSMMSYDYFPKVLEGNKDRNSNVKHVLYGVLTRYLRFLPQTHQGEVCMRTEVFGVQQKPSKSKNHYVMGYLHLLIYEQRFQT